MRHAPAVLLGEELESSQLLAANALQELLPELKALALNTKQVHWNVTGSAFRPVRELTDRIVQDTDEWADQVAERSLALGFSVDARPKTVAAVAGHVRPGRISDDQATVALIGLMDAVAARSRSALRMLERNDPVGHDIVIEVQHGLEKYRWLLRAQVAGRTDLPTAPTVAPAAEED